MSALLSHHGDALRQAARRLAGAPLGTLLSLLAIGIALALPATGYLLMANAARLAGSATPTPQISVFLKLEADHGAARDLVAQLHANSAIAALQLVTREQTLARMKTSAGLADVIDALQSNPFPDTIIVTPVDSQADAMEAMAADLRKLPAVEHVQLDSTWVRRVAALLSAGRVMVELLAAAFGLGLVAITFGTIRLQVLAHSAEIEVSRLLGATDGFVRRPFHYLGLLQGLLGGVIGCLLAMGGMAALQGPVNDLARLYGLDFRLASLQVADAALVIGLAALLGWAGAALSVRQHLGKT